MAHHRVHAEEFLILVSARVKSAHTQASRFGEDAVLDETDKVWLKQLWTFLGTVADDLVKTMAFVKEPGLDALKDARRMINRPNSNSPASILYNLGASLGYANNLVGNESTDTLVSVLSLIMQAWRDLDNALWHVNDAITEESE